MGEGWDEKLEIEMYAKKKARKFTAITDVLMVIVMILLMIVLHTQDIVVLSVMGVMLICLFTIILSKLLYLSYKNEAKVKISKNYVDEYLKVGNLTEVIPIKAIEYNSFITDTLPQIAKFYANISDEEFIQILIKFNGNEDVLEFEKIKKIVFKEYYIIKE